MKSRKKTLRTFRNTVLGFMLGIVLAIGSFGVDPAEAQKPVIMKWFMHAPEYTNAYNALIAEYKKVAPDVTIELEVMQADYPTVLKVKINADNTPDIFITTVGPELEAFAEYSADFSNEPYLASFHPGLVENYTYDNKVVGLPFKQDGLGVIYNKKMFADAGITTLPKTLSELETVCQTLQAKGITPFGNGFKEWWVYKHLFNHFLGAESDDLRALVGDFKAGKTTFKDHPLLFAYFDLIDFLVKYGLPKPLESDFNAEVTAIGTGKVAMITAQGTWAEGGIVKIDPQIDLGFLPLPVNEDPSKSKVIVGPTHAFRVNKNSPNLEAVQAFFTWLYTSDYGKRWFGDVTGLIGPIKDAPVPNMMLAKETAAYASRGETYSWAQNWSLDAFHEVFGKIMQDYIGKVKTRKECIAEIEKAWVKLGDPQ